MEVSLQEEEVKLEPKRPRVIWKTGPLAQVGYQESRLWIFGGMIFQKARYPDIVMIFHS